PHLRMRQQPKIVPARRDLKSSDDCISPARRRLLRSLVDANQLSFVGGQFVNECRRFALCIDSLKIRMSGRSPQILFRQITDRPRKELWARPKEGAVVIANEWRLRPGVRRAEKIQAGSRPCRMRSQQFYVERHV